MINPLMQIQTHYANNIVRAIIFPPGTDSISARVANIDTLTYNAGSTMVKTGRTATVRLALFGGLLHP